MRNEGFSPGDQVFISSTMIDLGPYRKAAQRGLERVGLVGVRLEQRWQHPSIAARTKELANVVAGVIRECSGLLVIRGERVGAFIESTAHTFTEHELEAALISAVPCFLFLTQGYLKLKQENTAVYESLSRRVSNTPWALVREVSSPEELERIVEEEFKKRITIVTPLCSVVLPAIDPKLIKELLANPQELSRVPDRFFEKLVADLLAADGWSVDLVVRTNAHGPDIVACSTQLIKNTPLRLIVECKRYREDRPVGIREIRNLVYWVEQEYQATLGLLATSSYFTKDAISLVGERHTWRLSLRDSTDIINWLKCTQERFTVPGEKSHFTI